MEQVYRSHTEKHRPERRGVSRRRVIDEAKARITVPEFVERLCEEQGKPLRRSGRELLTNCLLPDHHDRVPSFYADPEKNVFYCHGCVRGGDVIELARYVWGYGKAEVAMAAADLLLTFGHEIPPRPPAWRAKQERQRPIQDAIDRARFLRVRERLYLWLFAPAVSGIEDEEDRGRAEQEWWDATDYLARHAIRNMMGAGDGR